MHMRSSSDITGPDRTHRTDTAHCRTYIHLYLLSYSFRSGHGSGFRFRSAQLFEVRRGRAVNPSIKTVCEKHAIRQEGKRKRPKRRIPKISNLTWIATFADALFCVLLQRSSCSIRMFLTSWPALPPCRAAVALAHK